MKKRKLNLNKPVKMLTLVANPDSSLRPAGTELVPLGARVHLSSSRAGRIARACSQQAAVMVYWLRGASLRAAEVGGVIREGVTRAIQRIRPRSETPDGHLQIAAPATLEAVPHETDLAHEVRMLRAQVQTQNKILAELTYVLMDERKRVRESDQLVGQYDRRSESKLLQVLQANVGADGNWEHSKPTSARVDAD
jgi:hypothetical protein